MHCTDQLFCPPPLSLKKKKKKVVDVNLQKRTFVGIQFLIWTGGSWIKNNGKNFFVSLKPMKPSGKVILFFSRDYSFFSLTIIIICHGGMGLYIDACLRNQLIQLRKLEFWKSCLVNIGLSCTEWILIISKACLHLRFLLWLNFLHLFRPDLTFCYMNLTPPKKKKKQCIVFTRYKPLVDVLRLITNLLQAH